MGEPLFKPLPDTIPFIAPSFFLWLFFCIKGQYSSFFYLSLSSFSSNLLISRWRESKQTGGQKLMPCWMSATYAFLVSRNASERWVFPCFFLYLFWFYFIWSVCWYAMMKMPKIFYVWTSEIYFVSLIKYASSELSTGTTFKSCDSFFCFFWLYISFVVKELHQLPSSRIVYSFVWGDITGADS